MWLSAIKLAAQAGTHIFKKRQETKLEGRGRFDNSKFARVGARLGSDIG
jgi:hypothetical protein